MESSKAHLTVDIDKFTRIANEEFKKGNLEEAIKFFELATNCAFQYGDAFTERAAAFNLGGAYVAAGNPEKGLEYLQKAVPPMDKRDGASNGDLYYNFALAYEKLDDNVHMVTYLDKALQEYILERTNSSMIAHIGNRLGNIYAKDGQYFRAADNFGSTATAFGALNCTAEKVKSLNQQAFYLLKGGGIEKCVPVLDESRGYCNTLQDLEQKGKFLNDIGLSFTQCRDFNKACECFQEALPLCRGNKPDKKREAAICQNLGAIYNSLGDYEQALKYHEEAGTLHAQLGNRKCQGQCFINMAFAYSMLGNKESSNEYYLHGQQAAKDSGDYKCHWQALEGLGSLAVNSGDIDKAIKYYKHALNIMCHSAQDEKTHDRIVSKLTDAIQKKVMVDYEHGSQYESVASSRTGSRRGVESDFDQPTRNRDRVARDRMAANPTILSNPPSSRLDSRQGQRGVHVSNTMPTMYREGTREIPLQFAETAHAAPLYQSSRFSRPVSADTGRRLHYMNRKKLHRQQPHDKPDIPQSKPKEQLRKEVPVSQPPVMSGRSLPSTGRDFESSSASYTTGSETYTGSDSGSETEIETNRVPQRSPAEPQRAPAAPQINNRPLPKQISNDTSRTDDTVPVLSPSESEETTDSSEDESDAEDRAQVRAEMAKFQGDSSINRTLSADPMANVSTIPITAKVVKSNAAPDRVDGPKRVDAPRQRVDGSGAPEQRYSSSRPERRMYTSESETGSETDESETEGEDTPRRALPSGTYMNPLTVEGPKNGPHYEVLEKPRDTHTGTNVRFSETGKMDNTYESLRFAQTGRNDAQPGPSTNLEELPRGERERRLFEHQQRYSQRNGKDEADGANQRRSKACIVM